MKQLLTILIICSLPFGKGWGWAVNAQNLVPNFSFEQYSTCPTTGDEVNLCTGWSKYCANMFSPDYYNSCSSSSAVGVPQSSLIYQQDHRNCSAYIGLVTWSSAFATDREIVGIQLSQPLTIGQKYFLSFYTVMAGSEDASFYYESPSNNIGMKLSTVSYSTSNPAHIDNFAHLRSVSVISDTANWVRISGSIIADSAYNYLILGNFYDDSNTDTTTLNCPSCINDYSYYLVDDVCISTDSALCNGGIDALPCNVSVEELDMIDQFVFYPNPANDFLNIQNNFHSSFNINIYNTIGQQLYSEQNIIYNNLQLDISNYTNGLLFITITSNNNQFTYKLLKH